MKKKKNDLGKQFQMYIISILDTSSSISVHMQDNTHL